MQPHNNLIVIYYVTSIWLFHTAKFRKRCIKFSELFAKILITKWHLKEPFPPCSQWRSYDFLVRWRNRKIFLNCPIKITNFDKFSNKHLFGSLVGMPLPPLLLLIIRHCIVPPYTLHCCHALFASIKIIIIIMIIEIFNQVKNLFNAKRHCYQ